MITGSLLSYTLLTDGSSDKILQYPIEWLLREHTLLIPVGQWADLRFLKKPPARLAERCRLAIELYPCRLLFVHRDAEREARERRETEISQALEETNLSNPPAVCVVPVRMTEAWFLLEESVIRRAAGNPHGREILRLPSLANVEDEPNPKQALYTALKIASELRGRRLKQFQPDRAVHRLAELIDDFAPLRQLSAFAAFEESLSRTLDENGWSQPPQT